MKEEQTYWVALFDSVSVVMKAEKLLQQAHVPCKVIPVPKSISPDCGVCVRFLPEHKAKIEEALDSHVKINEIRELPRPKQAVK